MLSNKCTPLDGSLQVCVLVGLLYIASVSWGQVDTEDQPTSTQNQSNFEELDPLDRVKALLAAGEYEDVIDQATLLVDAIEDRRSRWDSALFEPLLLLGDGYRGNSEYVEALDTYDRARQVSRMAQGLHSLGHVEVVYREADTYYELGQIGRANDRHEYAYSIFLRQYEDFSIDLLPAIFRLADWYVVTRNIFPARGLFDYATKITEKHLDHTSLDNIRALKGLASTYRFERFMPPRDGTTHQTTSAITPWAENHPYIYQVKINDFAPGEEALKTVVEIEMEREGATQESLAQAKLDLADWFLLFEKYQLAGVVYKDIWEMYKDDQEATFLTDEFAEPVALYYPLAKSPDPQPAGYVREPEEGSIELSFSVTDRGKVKNIEVESVEPDDRFVDRFVESMEQARYRPVLRDGVVENRERVILTHDYLFYPSLEESE